jgi:chemotaxis protein CheX
LKDKENDTLPTSRKGIAMGALDLSDEQALDTLTDCVIKGTESIFTTILGSETAYCEGGVDGIGGEGVVGIISYVGDISWSMILVLPKESAIKMGNQFTGFEVPYDSPDMGDVVGELANVLAGDLVGRLSTEGVKVQMSLPTIMRGENVEPFLPRGIPSKKMGFSSSHGNFTLKVAGSKPEHVGHKKPGA